MEIAPEIEERVEEEKEHVEEKEHSEEKSEISVASAEEESESEEESEGTEISMEEPDEQEELTSEIECQRQKVMSMKNAVKLEEEKMKRMKKAVKYEEDRLQQLQIKALGEKGIIANADQVLGSESFPGVISTEMEVMGRRHLEKMTKPQLFQLLNHHDDTASQKTKKPDLIDHILSKGYHKSYAISLAQFFSKENSDMGIFEGISFEKSIKKKSVKKKKKKANDSSDEDSSSS